MTCDCCGNVTTESHGIRIAALESSLDTAFCADCARISRFVCGEFFLKGGPQGQESFVARLLALGATVREIQSLVWEIQSEVVADIAAFLSAKNN